MADEIELKWVLKSFTELSLAELYVLMQKRQEVFVLEQDCPYLDADGKDEKCHHLLGFDGNDLLAYSRLVPLGLIYPEVSIGRVLTTAKGRGAGLGYRLMGKTIEAVRQLYGKQPIRISAQSHLERFYHSFGFNPTGKNYLEDGIPHMEMLREASHFEEEA